MCLWVCQLHIRSSVQHHSPRTAMIENCKWSKTWRLHTNRENWTRNEDWTSFALVYFFVHRKTMWALWYREEARSRLTSVMPCVINWPNPVKVASWNKQGPPSMCTTKRQNQCFKSLTCPEIFQWNPLYKYPAQAVQGKSQLRKLTLNLVILRAQCKESDA